MYIVLYMSICVYMHTTHLPHYIYFTIYEFSYVYV